VEPFVVNAREARRLDNDAFGSYTSFEREGDAGLGRVELPDPG
jgi:hypothetical protein